MNTPSVSIIIPTWRAAEYLPKLIPQLRSQTLAPTEIIVIDSSSPDGSAKIAAELGCRVEIIPQREFNHGGTRNQGAKLATGEILVFMTQDAMPINEHYLGALVEPIQNGEAMAAYARQEAYPDATPLEKFARDFNYASKSHVKNKADLDTMGVKTYFFSDTASAVQKDAFWATGGFPDWVIVNEDMVLCANLLGAGHPIAYQAEARVYHSHRYGWLAIVRRYFDIGVFFGQAKDILVGGKSGGEGVRFAWGQVKYLAREGKWWWIPRSVVESGLKFGAMQMGKRSKWLPLGVKRWLSGQKGFWKKTSDTT